MKVISGTKEWASSNVNILFGCSNNCKYCYAKSMVKRHKKISVEDWNKPILRQDQLSKSFGKRKGTIMFPSTHDILPEFLEESMFILNKMLSKGNNVLIVSKPFLKCIKPICESFKKYKDQILFRFTIGSYDNQVLQFWEPDASSFEERVACLRYAHETGYKTSVSCEPMLSDNVSMIRLVKFIEEYVTDSIWLGKMNQATMRCAINTNQDLETINKAKEIVEMQSDNEIVKLYNSLKDYSKIKWKESIKEVVGIKPLIEKGLDI